MMKQTIDFILNEDCWTSKETVIARLIKSKKTWVRSF